MKINWIEREVSVGHSFGILWRAALILGLFSLIGAFLSVEEITDKTHTDAVDEGNCRKKESLKPQHC